MSRKGGPGDPGERGQLDQLRWRNEERDGDRRILPVNSAGSFLLQSKGIWRENDVDTGEGFEHPKRPGTYINRKENDNGII